MEKIKNNINDLIIDSVRPNELENLEELQACYDSRQSFYKKAYIGYYTFKNGLTCKYLKSYNTVVACIFNNQLRIYGGFSQTTARHIREFAKQNGFWGDISYKDMQNTIIFSK